MSKKIMITILSLCIAISFSVGPFVSTERMGYESGVGLSNTLNTANTAQQSIDTTAVDAEEQQVSASQKMDVGNHLDNGSFNRGTDGFSTTSTSPYSITTEANGNLYASLTFDSIYRVFTSEKTSLKAAVSYVFSFDYYIPADNSNQFAYGLSTVAGHPTTAQQLKPSGYAPFTITNRDTGATILTGSNTNTSLIHYGSGTRTVAVDGASRGNNGETGSWQHFEMSFTLASDAPSVYFYFMSYEKGVINGITLPYVANKVVNFDNVLIKGIYTPTVSAEAGGKAKIEILDTISTPGKVNEGGRVKFTATPSYLNGFKGWKNASGTIVSTEPTYIARLFENTALTATFWGYNNIRTYGAEYGMTDEGIDSSTTATYVSVSNGSGILSLGTSLTKVSGSSSNRYFRYNKMTLQKNTSYTLSFYLYNTGTSCSFGLFRDTGFSSAVGTSSASLTRYSVSASGETSLDTTTLPSSVYTPTSSDQWIHYTLSFNSADYSGSAYFALRYDGVPNPAGYLYIDNVSLANTSVITVMPGAGGTVTSTQFGGTVTASMGKEFQYGTYVTLNATADVGKNFLAWTDENNSPISYDISYTFCVNGPMTLRPLFDTGNEIYNGNFVRGTDGWKTNGDSASGVGMSVLSNDDLEAANIPRTPSGSPALKLSYNRTDTSLNKRVQAYSTYTMKTENYTTYEVSTWVYTAYQNARISLYVPTTSMPYQYDGTNDFTYVYGGYNIGATQLSGTYKYLLNDKQQSSNGGFSTYTDPYRSFDSAGNVNGWTKVSFVFTTDGNANCVKNATVSVGVKSYSNGGINYTSGTAYFTDITVKKYSNYHIKNNVKGGNVTVNDKVVLSSLDCTAQFGDPVKLNADKYNGFLFNGWYKDDAAVPFTNQEDVNLLYTGSATYTAKYRYDPLAPNFMLDDFESLLEPSEVMAENDGDINGDGVSDLKDITSLSRYVAGWQDIQVIQSKLDLTGDGASDLLDVTYLSRLIAGWDLAGNSTGNIPDVWKLLAEGSSSVQTGDSLSWGTYNVTDGAEFTAKPHGGNNMLAVYGRGNYSERLLDVKANTDYLLTFYWYQKTGVSNMLNSVAITANTTAIKVGNQAEYANSNLTGSFMAQNYTPITANGTWQKYTLAFNSKTNTQLKLFLKYSADSSTGADYLFLDDFTLLPLNTETASGTVTSLSVANNTTPLNNTFTGISATVYHCYTFMDDARGRNYTDEMAALEMDRLRDTGTKLVRTIFKSWFAWDDTKGTWNWESQRMQDSYRWALELQKRGINIALNASWSLNYMVEGTSSIPEVPYLYANGDYNLACSRYGEWMKQALQAFEAHGVHNITHLIVFTEPSRWTATQLEGPQAAQWVQACNALDTALRSAGIRNKYKLVGPNQGSTTTGEGLLKYVLEHGDSAVDIYSTHFYPRSTNATDDVYGSQTATAYKSYMDVMKRYNSVKDFWSDEYFAAATNSPLGTDSAWCGTQTAVGMTSAMNAGMEGMLSWQLFDQLWVDQTNTGGEFTDGIHVCGTAPSLFTSAVPRSQYYALTLLSKYFGYKNGKAYTSTSPAYSGLYISCAKLEDGSYTVMVVNAGTTDKKVQVNFGQAINQTLYRHLYDPDTVKPDARAKVLPADKVYNSVGTSLVDTVPSGGIAIYTGMGY